MRSTGGSFGITEKLFGHWKQFKALWIVFERLAAAVHNAGGTIAIE